MENIMKYVSLIFTVILAFTACTPYQESGFLGGVSATKLNDRLFQIQARGNAYTSGTRIRDYALLKASEIALGGGYVAFRVVDSQDISTTGSYTTPGSASSSTTGQINSYGSYTANTTTTYTAPRTTTFIKPGQTIHIYLLTNEDVGQYTDAYDANLVYSQIAPKYIKTTAGDSDTEEKATANDGNPQGYDASKKDDYETFQKWQPLAEQGDAEAQYELGKLYYYGYGVARDYQAAAKWTRLSAEQGNAEAQSNLGLSYYFGEGVPQDYQESAKWTRLSAEQGLARAQSSLGLSYYHGEGVPQDYQEGVKWTRLSAEQGDTVGQYSLGLSYYHGEGVPQDYIFAYMWANIATSNDNENKISARDLRDFIAKSMTPKQIAEGQKLSRECIKKKYKGC